MKILDLHECLGHTDTTEGRGSMIPVCYTEEASVAHQIVKLDLFRDRWGVMGCALGDYAVKNKQIKIFSTVQEYIDEVSLEAVRKRALGKLSPEEKKALGLKE